jgi:hypothetical protein
MYNFSPILLSALVVSSTIASPLQKRANDVVQGRLGSDGFWNDYDGEQGPTFDTEQKIEADRDDE